MGPVRVTGVTGQVSLDEGTFLGQTLTQTTITSPTGYSPLNLPQGGLIPGRYYRIHGGSGATFNGYTEMVLLRYGAPQTVALVTMPTGQLGTGLWIGNDDFAIVGRVSAGSSQTVPVALDVYLWLAARNPDGSDPVWQHPVSGVWYLTDVLGIAGPFHVDIDSKATAESLAFALPIPDEPGLQGGVLLMQWATVTPNQEAAVSDVFGAMITPPWPGSGTDAGSGQKREAAVQPSWLAAAKSMLPRVPEKSIVAIREWLASRPSLSPRGAGLAVWQSIVRKE
jgi:hypothetical protein